MKRTLIFAYGFLCYGLFLATFLYLIAFFLDLPVPRSMNVGPEASLPEALLVNAGLLLVFCIQHSGMARRGFKSWLTRVVPVAAERSTYVLVTCVVLMGLFWLWRPIPTVLWDLEAAWARASVYGLFGLGLALVLYSTFLIDHFDLFGLRQVVLHWRDRPYVDKQFRTPTLYRFVRHPLYVGWIMTMFAAPTMTGGRLLFAVGLTGYTLLAIIWEERDLVRAFGEEYREYQRRTPRIIPSLTPRDTVELPVTDLPVRRSSRA